LAVFGPLFFWLDPPKNALWPKVVLRIGCAKGLWPRKPEVNCPDLKTNITMEANIMATHEHFKLGNLVKAGVNYGFDIVDEHKKPLFSITYHTEVEAKAAHTAIERALAKAVAVGTR
jgi:hypothetical protein